MKHSIKSVIISVLLSCLFIECINISYSSLIPTAHSSTTIQQDTTLTSDGNEQVKEVIKSNNSNFNVLTKRKETLWQVDLKKGELSLTERYSSLPKNSVVHIEKTLTQGTRTFYQTRGFFLKIKHLVQTKKKETLKMNVPYISQTKRGYPFGCEIVTAYQNMKYLQMNVNLDVLVKKMPKVGTKGDPRKGFQGTPTKIVSNYNTIWPQALHPYLKKTAKNTINISASSKSKIISYIMKGMPVALYSTHKLGAKPIIYNHHYFGTKKVENLHVYSIAGYSKQSDKFYVVDPIFGKHWIKANLVIRGYNPTKFAIAFRK